LRIVFEECREFRGADDEMLFEAILLALDDAHTRLHLSSKIDPVIQVHEDRHDPQLVEITAHKLNSVAVFQSLPSDTKVALLDLIHVGAKKGVSRACLSTIIASQDRKGTRIAY